MKSLLHQWFGSRVPVSRVAYAFGSALLLGLHLVLEGALFAGRRTALLRTAPVGLVWMWIALALPFAWVGVSMSVRRATDAGLSARVGLLFLVPGVRYALVLALSCLPSRAPQATQAQAGSPYRPPPPQAQIALRVPQRALAIGRSVALAASVGLGMFGLAVNALGSDGAALLVVVPFMAAALTAMACSAAQRNPSEGEWQASACGAGCGLVAVGVLTAAFFRMQGGHDAWQVLLPAGVCAWLGTMAGVVLDAWRAPAAGGGRSRDGSRTVV